MELVSRLPNNDDKKRILTYILRQFSNIRTEVTINTHFAILLTLVDDKDQQSTITNIKNSDITE